MNPEWISARGSCLEVASSLRGNQDIEIKKQGQDKSNQAGYYGYYYGYRILWRLGRRVDNKDWASQDSGWRVS